MENNSYFNYPILPVQGNTYIVGGLAEYVSLNPLTMQQGYGTARTTLLSLGSQAALEGKPFALSEWNEYGVFPLHSTSFAQMAAYACLNDWDGLILYNHHTSQRWDDQPADEILNVFDAYNDPSLIAQWGFLATVFLQGLLAPAPHRVDLVFTQEDLATLPNMNAMPNCFLPYVTRLRNVFLDGGTPTPAAPMPPSMGAFSPAVTCLRQSTGCITPGLPTRTPSAGTGRRTACPGPPLRDGSSSLG